MQDVYPFLDECDNVVLASPIAQTIMKFMNVRRPCVATVYALDTNNIPAEQDAAAMKNAREAALLLNNLYCDKPD